MNRLLGQERIVSYFDGISTLALDGSVINGISVYTRRALLMLMFFLGATALRGFDNLIHVYPAAIPIGNLLLMLMIVTLILIIARGILGTHLKRIDPVFLPLFYLYVLICIIGNILLAIQNLIA